MVFSFSIIIPHKNIPHLLERLIKSIPVRDDLEIIVVDDHSDGSVKENLNKIERDNLTFLFNQDCRGAGFARNCALPIAKGKWVLFADSDDFFNQGFNDFLDEYYTDKNRGELILRYLFTEPWCKMVKRDIIERYQIRFEETSIRNDVRYSYLVGHYASKIIVDNRQLYCVTTRNNSVSRGVGRQASLDELKVFAGWKKFLMDHKVLLDLPKFDLCLYNFTRHLWKDNRLFRKEYRVLREIGLSHTFIIRQILKYVNKSIGYKM